YKAAVVKLGAKGDSAAVFDRCTMRLSAAWTGGYLNHSDRRFGLLNTPTPKGDLSFAAPAGPGWADPDGKWHASAPRFTAPLPSKWAKYEGHYLHGEHTIFAYRVGNREILEAPQPIALKDHNFVESVLEVGDGKNEVSRFLCELLPNSSTTLEAK